MDCSTEQDNKIDDCSSGTNNDIFTMRNSSAFITTQDTDQNNQNRAKMAQLNINDNENLQYNNNNNNNNVHIAVDASFVPQTPLLNQMDDQNNQYIYNTNQNPQFNNNNNNYNINNNNNNNNNMLNNNIPIDNVYSKFQFTKVTNMGKKTQMIIGSTIKDSTYVRIQLVGPSINSYEVDYKNPVKKQYGRSILFTINELGTKEKKELDRAIRKRKKRKPNTDSDEDGDASESESEGDATMAVDGGDSNTPNKRREKKASTREKSLQLQFQVFSKQTNEMLTSIPHEMRVYSNAGYYPMDINRILTTKQFKDDMATFNIQKDWVVAKNDPNVLDWKGGIEIINGGAVSITPEEFVPIVLQSDKFIFTSKRDNGGELLKNVLFFRICDSNGTTQYVVNQYHPFVKRVNRDFLVMLIIPLSLANGSHHLQIGRDGEWGKPYLIDNLQINQQQPIVNTTPRELYIYDSQNNININNNNNNNNNQINLFTQSPITFDIGKTRRITAHERKLNSRQKLLLSQIQNQQSPPPPSVQPLPTSNYQPQQQQQQPYQLQQQSQQNLFQHSPPLQPLTTANFLQFNIQQPPQQIYDDLDIPIGSISLENDQLIVDPAHDYIIFCINIGFRKAFDNRTALKPPTITMAETTAAIFYLDSITEHNRNSLQIKYYVKFKRRQQRQTPPIDDVIRMIVSFYSMSQDILIQISYRTQLQQLPIQQLQQLPVQQLPIQQQQIQQIYSSDQQQQIQERYWEVSYRNQNEQTAKVFQNMAQ